MHRREPRRDRQLTRPTRSTAQASRTALRALILRDLLVLRKNFAEFLVRTLIQPFLLVFVFLYVFPSIGQGVGGGGGPVRESAFATVLVPGVVGDLDHVPGDPGCRAAALHRVWLHARDRGSRPGPVSDLAGRCLKGALGVGAGRARGGRRLPDRRRDPRPGRGSPPLGSLVDRDHPDPAGLRGDDLARAAARHYFRAAQHRADVRIRGAAADLPRRHLLPVDANCRRSRSMASTGCKSWYWSTP